MDRKESVLVMLTVTLILCLVALVATIMKLSGTKSQLAGCQKASFQQVIENACKKSCAYKGRVEKMPDATFREAGLNPETGHPYCTCNMEGGIYVSIW